MSRTITDVLGDLGQGHFLGEAGDALQQLVNAVSETGRGGSLTLTLKLKKSARGACAITVQDDIKLTLPKQDARETMMFATPEGNLLTEDPRQSKLPLQTAPGTEKPAAADLKVIPPKDEKPLKAAKTA